MFVAWSIHHPINNWSFVDWCRSKKALKCSWLYFFSRLKYMLYNSTQQILTKVTNSHTKVFCPCTNFISVCIAFNTGMMQIKPMIISMSQRYHMFVFATTIMFTSSLSSSLKYSIRTHQIGDKYGDPPSLYTT